METTTTPTADQVTKAIASIDMELAEEHTGYTFETLRDRFERGYRETVDDGWETVCVKPPSGYEISFATETVRVALGLAR